MSGTRALVVGLRRALLAPHVVVLLLLVNAACALPAAWWVRDEIQSSIGERVAHERMLESFDSSWFAEWSPYQRGLTETFEPELSGGGFAWRNLEGWLDGTIFGVPFVALAIGALHALVWLWLLGGILDGWLRVGERRGVVGFVRACNDGWGRLVRQAACALPLYGVIYLLHGRMAEQLEAGSRDLAREMPAIFQMFGLYALTALLLTLVNLWFTAGKVATIADRGCGALRGLGRGGLFLLRRFGSAVGLYYALLALGGLLFAGWSLVAPGATHDTPTAIALAFAAGQLFLAARLVLRLAVFAGLAELYRTGSVAADKKISPSGPASPPAPKGE